MKTKSLKNSSLSKRTIIQCPSCTTRFAVAKQKLSNATFPRFHCSRCDKVFGFKEEDLEEINETKTPLKQAIGTPIFSIAETVANSQDDDLRNPKKTIDIPSEIGTKTPEPPHEQLAPDAEDKELNSFRKNIPNTSSISAEDRELPEDQITFDFTQGFKEPEPGEFSPSISLNTESLKARGLIDDPKNKNKDGPRVTSTLLDIPDQYKKLKKRGAPSGPWSNVGLLTAPLIGCFLLLTIFSIYMSQDVDGTSKMTKSLFPSAPQVAPAGLSLKDIKFDKVVLENGDSVHVISGSINNSSNKVFEDIVLEGLVFGADGKILKNIRVNTSSTLAGTRIKSLSLDMIDKIQDGSQASRLELKPGTNSQFAIAFSKGFETTPNFYSARIFSVRY